MWITPLGLALVMIAITQSASEGASYPRLRFGLVYQECHPVLNHGGAPPQESSGYRPHKGNGPPTTYH